MADEQNPSSGKVAPDPRNVRRWPRFKVDEETAIVLYPEKLRNFMGLGRSNRAKAAVNLSEGGVLVRTTEKLEPETRVRLTISIEKFGDKFDCIGEVAWCYASARSSSEFYAGVKFLDLPPSDIKKIEKMRSWFSSPEFKAKTKFRRKDEGPQLLTGR